MSADNHDTLVNLARDRAQRSPDKLIYRYLDGGETEGPVLSYASLDRRARAIAAELQRRGLAGERLLLLYPPGLDYIAAFFGCIYAGAIAVPVYPPHPRRLDRLISVARDAAPAAALTVSAIADKLSVAMAGTPDWPQLAWIGSDNLDEAQADNWRDPNLTGRSLAFLQYTSGSTSNPKGVMLSHANLLHNEQVIMTSFSNSSESIGVGWLPLYHDMGLIGNVLQPMYADFPVILMSPLDFVQSPIRWLKAISKYRGTHSGGPNFSYELCVRRSTPEQREGLDLSSWKLAFCGAERIDAAMPARFAGAFGPYGFRASSFFACYGLAEASLLVTGSELGAGALVKEFSTTELSQKRAVAAAGTDARPLVGCGRVVAPQHVVVVDPESHVPCEPSRIGEIWVSGDSVAQGYFRRREQTEATFGAKLSGGVPAEQQELRFLRTGDLGFMQDGELFVTGRIKDLIIVRGRNHSPEDIERDVHPLDPSLRPGCCAAFSVLDRGVERLVIVQEVRRKAVIKLETLVDQVKQMLFQRHDLGLTALVLIREGTLGKTSSGKIQRHAARAAYLSAQLDVVAHYGPLPEPNADGGERAAAVRSSSHVLPLSAKSERALRGLAGKYRDRLAGGDREALADLCLTAAIGRAHLRYRAAVVADDVPTAIKQLEALESGSRPVHDCADALRRKQALQVAFLFSGQGSHYTGMGRALYATSGTFREALERCAQLLEPVLGLDLLRVIFDDGDEHRGLLADTRYAQPALFSIEYALAEMWQARNVRPTHLAGHSLGEYVAAQRAGVFSLQDALSLVAERGRLMSELKQDGSMLAVEASEAELAGVLRAHQAAVAAINGPRQLTLALAQADVPGARAALQALGIRHKLLDVHCAFHSAHMEPMADAFRQIAERISYRAPQLPIVSNLTGQLISDEIACADYWVRQLREPVQFEGMVHSLAADGCKIFVEVGPRVTLLPLARECVAGPDEMLWLPSLRAQRPDSLTVAQSLGALYERGANIDWCHQPPARPAGFAAKASYRSRAQGHEDGPALECSS